MEIKYIGEINAKSIRDYILDSRLTDEDTITLNQIDFDELALKYREEFRQSLPEPFILLRILVKEDLSNKIPLGRIGIIKNDSESISNTEISDEIYNPDDIIYRCGYCGNFVGGNGAELDSITRHKNIKIFEKFKNQVVLKHVHGNCCVNKR